MEIIQSSPTSNDTNSTSADPVSILIFHLVLAATSEDFLKNLLLICCMTTLVIVLVIMFSKMSNIRTMVIRLARRIGMIEQYQVYTISDEKKILSDADGTESTAGEFDYVSMTS